MQTHVAHKATMAFRNIVFSAQVLDCELASANPLRCEAQQECHRGELRCTTPLMPGNSAQTPAFASRAV
jgi:hypothetical protein